MPALKTRIRIFSALLFRVILRRAVVAIADGAEVSLEVWVRLVWGMAADLAEGLAIAALAADFCRLCATYT